MSDTLRPSSPKSSPEPAATSRPAAASAQPPVAGRADAALSAVRNEAGKATEAVKAEATKQFEKVRDGAEALAGGQKDAAARQLAGIATAMKKTAEELEADQPAVAGYTRSIASGIDRASSNLKNRDVDSLVGMAEDYGRNQPAAMLGIAAVAGFLTSRFLMASGRRREAQSSRSGVSTNSQANPRPSFPGRQE